MTPILAGLLDLVTVGASGYLAHWIRFENFLGDPDYTLLILPGSMMFVLLCAATNIYSTLGTKGPFTRLMQLALVWAVSFALVFGYLVFSKTSEDFSRLWLGYWIISGFALLVILRILVSWLITTIYSRRANRQRILLIGDPDIAHEVVRQSEELGTFGYAIQGFVNTHAQCTCAETGTASFSLTFDELQNFVQTHDIAEVWVCLSLKEEDVVEQVNYALRHTTADIRQILGTPELNLLAKNISEIGGVSTLDVSCSPHYGPQYFLKLLEDYTLGLVMFAVALPFFLVIAIAIKLDSRGPILFKQYRHGVNGKRFKVYKFRTMEVHKEPDGAVTQAKKNDPRVTSVGKLLRATSLDELPQLYNVLQGRMSIVGPRPHALIHNDYYKDLIDSYMRRHMVKPGLTGWAQIHGFRGETSDLNLMKERVDHDLFYIENWSLWLDLKIILLTPLVLLARKNAY